MSVSMFSLFGHALLLLISFSGLCAGIRTVLKIHRFIAPYMAACGVIAILMLAGMARILELSFWALYILGFICCIYAYLIKRQRPEFGMIAALCVFFIFLVWRFYFCPLHRNDDISHWGLVARHLLRHDAFPDANAQHIFFQSYPLGAASFIYYIGKTLGNTEGIYLVAQDLLQGLLFLPVFAHICDHRKTYYPIAVAFYLLLFSFFRNMVNLQVDLLLSFFGIGMIAAVSYYRNDIKKAVLTGLIGMIAIVYVKNSGLFFAFITSLLLGYCGHRGKKKGFSIGRLIVVSFAISVIAYSLWMLHIRLSYPAALETKHAVSLSAYAAEASSKSLSVILQITKSYLKELFSLSFPQFCAYSFILLCVGYLVYGSRTTSPLRQENLSLPKLFRILLVCLSVYLLWALLVFLMYIFSMPEEEALRAASFYRYNGTGLGFVMGLIAIIFFSFFGRKNLPCPAAIRTLSVLCLAFIVMFLAVSPLDMSKIPFAKRIFERRTELGEHRAGLISAHAEYNLPNGGTFLAYCKDNDTNQGPFYEYYHVKYEFETANIYMIAESDGMYLAGTKDDKELYTDPSEFIADTIDGCEAFFVMDESPDFQFFLDSFLETYTGDTPVIYTYKY